MRKLRGKRLNSESWMGGLLHRKNTFAVVRRPKRVQSTFQVDTTYVCENHYAKGAHWPKQRSRTTYHEGRCVAMTGLIPRRECENCSNCQSLLEWMHGRGWSVNDLSVALGLVLTTSDVYIRKKKAYRTQSILPARRQLDANRIPPARLRSP